MREGVVITPESLGSLANYGILGLVTLLLVFEKLVPYGRLKREQDLTDKTVALIDAQSDAIRQLTTAQEAANRLAEQRGRP